jgi:IPT/TIG domain
MSLTKRRMSRRALGVVVGASLLVLGLQAPAWAVPAITGITPNSGPTDCVVVVTGSGFAEFPAAQTDVDFVAGATVIPATLFTVISDTEIWATVPALTPGTSYNVRVSNTGTPGGTTSTATFLSTTGAGACAPTIASFLPTCGEAGTVVAITGTNLLAPDHAGGEIAFSPYAAGQVATHTVPDQSSPTSLSVIVPTGSGDGPLRVTTFGAATGGRAFSTASFQVPPPDCTAGPVTHERSISLSLKKHLIAKGAVTVADDTAECMAGVPVKIQRKKKGGGWKNVGSTTTNDAGKYKRSIKDKPGKYRALAPKVTLADDSVCAKDVSPRVRHTH